MHRDQMEVTGSSVIARVGSSVAVGFISLDGIDVATTERRVGEWIEEIMGAMGKLN